MVFVYGHYEDELSANTYDASGNTWNTNNEVVAGDLWGGYLNYNYPWGVVQDSCRNLHLIYVNNAGSLHYRLRTSGLAGTWSTITNSVTGLTSHRRAALSRDSSDNLYLFYDKNDNKIYCRKYNGLTWGAEQNVKTDATPIVSAISCYEVMSSGRIGLTWEEGAASPYNVVFQEYDGGASLVPVVCNGSGASNVAATNAMLNGLLTSTGTAQTAVWVFWGDNDGGTAPIAWDHAVDFGARTQGEAMAYSACGLNPNGVYYYRFYAENANGGTWASSSESFNTLLDMTRFSCRMMISFTNYNRAEPLTNFPALVTLGANLTGFGYTQFVSSAGGDLRFTDATTSSALNYEVENWTTNTNSYVWVQVPVFTNNCHIWAYWGNPVATNPPACTTNGATWDTYYKGVWHMAQTNALDSTTNRHHGQAQGSVTLVSTGLVDGANEFDADVDYVAVADSADFTLSGDYTVSALILSHALADWEIFMGTYCNLGLGFVFGLRDNVNNTLSFRDSAGWQLSTLAIPDWEWKYVAYTRQGTNGIFFVDGTNAATIATAAAGTDGKDLYLGGGGAGYPAYKFDGLIDEARISWCRRSTNWIWAECRNMASNSWFNSYSTVESLLRVRNLAATGITWSNATMRGEILNTGGTNPDVFVCWGTNDYGTAGTGSWEHTESLGNGYGAWATFETNITGLISNTLYYYRCYVTNSTGEDWGNPAKSFRSSGAPAISNRMATSISQTAATLNGYLACGPADVTFYWGLSDGVETPGSWANTSAVGSAKAGWVSTTVTVLAGGTYYYRCYATNEYGFDWANDTTNFATLPALLRLNANASSFMEPGGTVTVTARLDVTAVSNVTVNFSFEGTASSNVDYAMSATSITIAAGNPAGTIVLTGIDDSDLESAETVTVRIASVVAAEARQPNSATITLYSEDPQITNTGATSVTATNATLNGNFVYGYTGTVYVFWGDADGGTNQASWGNTNNLGPRSEGAFSIAVSNLWANKTYYYRCYVTNDWHIDWADSTTNFTTPAPNVTIGDATVTEGNSGTTNLTFALTLSAQSATNVWVVYATADGTAVAGTDYTAANGLVLCSAGETTKTVTVTAIGDTLNEWPSEFFYLNATSATNGVISRNGVGTITDDDSGMSEWARRMRISFTNYNRTEPLTNFPALVVFKTSLTGFSYSQFASTNGYDLRFTDATTTNPLNYEIESWATNTNSYVWVQVPIFTNNCHIWAYWGNADATSVLPCTTNGATWSSSHLAVWHLHTTNAASRFPDSTTNQFGGINSGCANVSGQIAGAQSFIDGSSDINITGIAHAGGANSNRNYTFSYWLKTTTTWNYARLTYIVTGPLIMDITTSGTQIRYHDGTWRTPYGTNLNDGAWHHVAIVLNGASSLGAIYEDGVAMGTGIAYAPKDIGGDACMGSGGGCDYVGFMDEARVETVARSSNWVWACWLNAASNAYFNTYGDGFANTYPTVFVWR
ncbi:MAG: DUF2341 domain-containing protein [Verrucomicrobiota bacterium]|nr:DUF2341 domain-containing protein [Verrucomicrobiota bacterium]